MKLIGCHVIFECSGKKFKIKNGNINIKESLNICKDILDLIARNTKLTKNEELEFINYMIKKWKELKKVVKKGG